MKHPIAVLVVAIFVCPSILANGPDLPDPNALIQKAVANYRARGDHRRDYTYLEEVGTQWGHLPPDFNTYENIFVNGTPYRRHIRFNGKTISPEDDQTEHQKMLEAHWRYQAGGFKVSSQGLEKANEDLSATVADPQVAALRDGIAQVDALKRRYGTTSNPCSAVFPKHLSDLRLLIEEIDSRFDFRNGNAELFGGRPTWVVDAFPKPAYAGKTDDLLNFQLRIWIDREDLEISRIEATAIREGMLSSADHYVLSFIKHPSESLVTAIQKSLESTKLTYSSDTKLVMEWRKFNNEVWLPVYSSISGTEIHMAPTCGKKKVSFMKVPVPSMMEVIYSDYKKFRAETRIFSPEEVSGP